MSSSQLTKSIIFQRGIGIPPTRNYRLLDLCYPMIIPSFTNVNPLLNDQITNVLFEKLPPWSRPNPYHQPQAAPGVGLCRCDPFGWGNLG